MHIENIDLNEKREYWIKVRVTKSEKVIISQKAKNLGQTVSAFILFRTLNYRLRKDITHKEKILQLTKIGNNLNQIARWANTHGNKAEVIAMFASLLSLEKQIRAFADTAQKTIFNSHSNGSSLADRYDFGEFWIDSMVQQASHKPQERNNAIREPQSTLITSPPTDAHGLEKTTIQNMEFDPSNPKWGKIHYIAKKNKTHSIPWKLY